MRCGRAAKRFHALRSANICSYFHPKNEQLLFYGEKRVKLWFNLNYYRSKYELVEIQQGSTGFVAFHLLPQQQHFKCLHHMYC